MVVLKICSNFLPEIVNMDLKKKQNKKFIVRLIHFSFGSESKIVSINTPYQILTVGIKVHYNFS